ALDDAVVQVDVRDRRAPQRVEVDGVVVVLAGDLNPARRLVAHRVVGAVVAEPQLERLGAECEPEDLVSEADAEHRHLAEEAGDGAARTADSSVPDAPGSGPASRRWRVSGRVSMPAMPGTRWRRRNSSRLSVARQLLGRRASSRTSTPAQNGRRLSTSSGFTP